MPRRSAQSTSSNNNSIQNQLLSTLKWLLLVLFIVTGSITWKLVITNNNDYGRLLDLPPNFCPNTTATQQLGSTLSSPCQVEYQRVTANRTQGLTEVDLEQSRAFLGNRHRLALLAHTLQTRKKPVDAVFCGGSITLGHGVRE
jgi:hypothetical protein